MATPENTPMKFYWQDVPGQSTPVAVYYPQYWSETVNDWVISSEQSRLPVDAQLTGSIPEEVKQVRTTVVAGSTSSVINAYVGDFKEYAVHVSTNGAANPYVVYCNFSSPSIVTFFQTDDYKRMHQLFPDDGMNRPRMISDRFKILGNTIIVNLYNTDKSDWIYNVTLIGYRR